MVANNGGQGMRDTASLANFVPWIEPYFDTIPTVLSSSVVSEYIRPGISGAGGIHLSPSHPAQVIRIMNDPEPKPDKAQKYWRSNLILVTVLLSVWAIAGFGLSIFLIKTANQFEIGSVGFGFWMAQQGSIFVFVVLVLVYAFAMDWIDRKHKV